MAERQLTGKHVLIITVSAFAVIIAVNVTMAVKAVGTFPGLEVKNSYVASQQFDERRAEQLNLGWTVQSNYADGRLHLVFVGRDGAPVRPRDLSVLIGRTTEARDDMRPEFAQTADGFEAPVDLGVGKWMMRVEAVAEDGTRFQQRLELRVRS